jgi:hypothetical protein
MLFLAHNSRSVASVHTGLKEIRLMNYNLIVLFAVRSSREEAQNEKCAFRKTVARKYNPVIR